MSGNENQTHPAHTSQDAHQQDYSGPDRRQGPRRHPDHQSASVFIEGVDQRASSDRRAN